MLELTILSKFKHKCAFCKKIKEEKVDYFKGLWLHKTCFALSEEEKSKKCRFCKKSFTKENPRISKHKRVHKNCELAEKRNIYSINNPYSGGTWSKK